MAKRKTETKKIMEEDFEASNSIKLFNLVRQEEEKNILVRVENQPFKLKLYKYI
jgi:hypothetical protein